MGNSDQGESISDCEKTSVSARGSGALRELQEGTVVGGSYRLKGIIGRGGMGVVYLCEHLMIGRQYALKALAPDQINESNWARFHSEGKAIARLDHRNIVKIYDMGSVAQTPYYVMDLLDGQSLADFIRSNGPLTELQALEIFGQICAGLGYAHQSGIIHRDVKPSNIILINLDDGKNTPLVKIVDFGLAKLVGNMASISQSQTATGEVFGSPLYMSPEQCLGAKIDERSDIYSLGCSLFECLTGRPPFVGENAFQTVLMHQNEKPPRLADEFLDREFTPAMEDLVQTMLQKRPAERQQSMAAVAHDLARAAKGKSIKAAAIFSDAPLFAAESQEESERRSSSLPVLLFVILGLLVLLAGGVAALVAVSPQPEIHLTADQIRARDIIKSLGPISNGVVNYEGQSVRLFRFPDLPLGKITADGPNPRTEVARGIKFYMPTEHLTLDVVPPEGDYILLFPEVLSHFGPGDINRLMFNINHVSFKFTDVPDGFFTAIKDWNALEELDIDEYPLTQKTLIELNAIHPVKKLHFRGSTTDSKIIAALSWLNQVNQLDVKRIDNVDPILVALQGSPNLEQLFIDRTSPSAAALEGLRSCPRLYELAASDSDIDDARMKAVGQLYGLKYLVLKDSNVTGACITDIAKLKNLRDANLETGGVSEADKAKLRLMLPNCNVK